MKITNLRGKKILVTGGKGFLGSNLCKKFRENGAKVFAPSKKQLNLINLTNVEETFSSIMPDIVVHAAGLLGGIEFSRRYPADVFIQNLTMACNILFCSNKFKIKKLVNIGSACVYSDELDRPFKETDIMSKPMHPSVQYYGFSKIALYLGGIAYKEQSNMKSIHLIPANLYGPGDKFDPDLSHVVSSMIPKFYHAMKTNSESVECWGTGQTIREFLYIDDCADAIIKATMFYEKSKPLNIGLGQGLKILEVANLIKKVTGYQGKIIWDNSKPDGASYKVVDINKINAEIAWKPYTSFESGLEKTVAWFSKNYDKWLVNSTLA